MDGKEEGRRKNKRMRGKEEKMGKKHLCIDSLFLSLSLHAFAFAWVQTVPEGGRKRVQSSPASQSPTRSSSSCRE